MSDASASPDHGRAGFLHRQVAADLDRRISAGEFPIGARLPGEHALALTYRVSRGTVRSALADLARRGVVVAHRGTGWIVQSSLHTQGLRGFRSFAQWARERGLEPGGRVVAAADGAANGSEARILRIGLGEGIHRVTRLRTLDGQPVMIERTVYPPWVAGSVRDLPPDTPSFVEAMADRGIVEAFGVHRIDAVAASGDDARLLGVRRSGPLLQVQRHAYAPNGRPIDYSEDRYLPGVVTFEIQASAGHSTAGRSSESGRPTRPDRCSHPSPPIRPPGPFAD